MSKVYELKRTQLLHCSLEKAWAFFSDPNNLADITPPDMSFKVTSVSNGNKMYAGQVIEYIVKPVLGIPVYWMTEITHVEEGKFFVDEQRFGPYSFWHHQHHFETTAEGTLMTDMVHYKLPFWFFGDIAHAVFVKKKLEGIFDYRLMVTEKMFG